MGERERATALFLLVARNGVPGAFDEDKEQQLENSWYCHPELAKAAKPFLESMIKSEQAGERGMFIDPQERMDVLQHQLAVADAMISAEKEKAYKIGRAHV